MGAKIPPNETEPRAIELRTWPAEGYFVRLPYVNEESERWAFVRPLHAPRARSAAIVRIVRL